MRILCPTYWYPEHAKDIHATYVHDINRHLVRLGHEVLVVTPRIGDAAKRESFDGVEIVRFPASIPEDLSYGKVAQSRIGIGSKARRLAAMGSYLVKQYAHTVTEGKRWNADIVHGHWAIPTGPALVSAANRLGCPSVITLHGGDVYVNEEQGYDFPLRWYVKPILRWTLRSANALTAISDDCRQHALKAGAIDERVHLIMNGADLRRFSPGERTHPEFGDQMIFACRQLIPRKGIRFLIDALAKLKDEFPRATVVVAGDGMEREALEKRAAELGVSDRVHLLGWVSNDRLPEYYRSAVISVIPSIEEGFGIPAAEAMGCELPVIATDAGGLPEVVDDGTTGFVVPRADAQSIADAMRKLLDDEALRQQFGRAGRQKALAEFDWMNTAQSMESLYFSLFEKPALRHA
jgi:glycosyltransferase involved in cell wall biosynthesis